MGSPARRREKCRVSDSNPRPPDPQPSILTTRTPVEILTSNARSAPCRSECDASQIAVARFPTLVRAAGSGGSAKSSNCFVGGRPFLRDEALCEGRRWDGSALWRASLWIEFSFGPVLEGCVSSMRGFSVRARPPEGVLPCPLGAFP